MGTNSTTKFIKNVSGTLTEQFALTTSAGAGDANAIPALNASGVLDPTILNGSTTGGGANANKIPQLNASGQLDTTMMPSGIGAPTASIVASEAIGAGAFVNIWNNAGTANIRNASAAAAGKTANGFVLAAVSSGASGTVYMGGINSAVSGQVAGPVYLSDTVIGAASATAATTTGHTVQLIGVAYSATAIDFTPGTPITLA